MGFEEEKTTKNVVFRQSGGGECAHWAKKFNSD